MNDDQRSLIEKHSDEKHWSKRIHFDRYCCLFQTKSKSILKNENLIEIEFRSSQILSASWFDAKSSKIAHFEACIEFCWIDENVSHQTLFLFFDRFWCIVYIFEHVNEHIAFFARNIKHCDLIMWSCHSSISCFYCLNMSTNILCFEACIRSHSMCKSWCCSSNFVTILL